MPRFFYKINIILLALLLVLTAIPLPLLAEDEAPLDEGQGVALEVEPETVVSTGEAQGAINVGNQVNFNQTTFTARLEDKEEEGVEPLGDLPIVDDEDRAIALDDNLNTTTTPTSTENCLDCGGLLSGNEDTGDESENDSSLVIDNSNKINNANEANIDNEIEGEVNSGDNSVAENEGSASLFTGNLNLVSNILNLVNVNIIGSDYLQVAYNLVGKVIGDLDLSRYQETELAEMVKSSSVFSDLLALNSETGKESDNQAEATVDNSLQINNDNQAEINNQVDLEADSGSNVVSDNGGPVKVVTGNISVAANVVNIVNTNIVGNGWTLAIVNVMGDWAGDLVLPSLTNFVSSQQDDYSLSCPDIDCLGQILTATNENTGKESDNQAEATVDNSLQINNDNQAEINNQVDIEANSGGNEVEENQGDAAIKTGKVTTLTQVINKVNTSVLANNWVFGLVNVVGGWLGNFYGQPDDNFQVEDFGSYFTFSWKNSADQEAVPAESETEAVTGNEPVVEENENGAKNENTGDDSSNQAETKLDNSVEISNSNKATINNVIKILANSGNNVIAGNGGEVNLQTGDVKAIANLFNMVNSNYVGDNWTIALVNVIGSWQGDIHFGRPDLVVTEVAVPDPEPAIPGGYIDYYITVTNKGDAPATDVVLTANYDPTRVTVVDSEGGKITDNSVVWKIDKLEIGAIEVRHYRAQIDTGVDGDEDLSNHSEVWSVEEDRNPQDNVADTLVHINSVGAKIGGWGFPVSVTYPGKEQDNASVFANPVYNQSLEIEKTSDAGEIVYRGQLINYRLRLFNRSHQSLSDVIVYDNLIGPDGQVVNNQQWSLGEVKPQEEIVIDYSIRLGENAPAGRYVNFASADGFDAEGRYSIFPQASTEMKVATIDKELAGQYVDIQYFYQPVKKLGESYEETIILTNVGKEQLPAGQLVMTYGSDLKIKGQPAGGAKFLVPELKPGENYTIQFQAEGAALSAGSLLQVYYLTLGEPVAALAVDYKIEEQLPGSFATDNGVQNEKAERNTAVVGQISSKEPPASKNNQGSRQPQVLGYMHKLNAPTLIGSINSANNFSPNFWSELRNNIFSWWVWAWLVVLLVLLEIYRRLRRGEKVWQKTFGFRIF